MHNKELFLEIAKEAKQLWFPKLAIKQKINSQFMMAINWLFNFFKPKDQKDWFINNYWTTIIYSIYPPISSMKKSSAWPIGTLLHELKHCFQAKRLTPPLFAFLYLWPLSQGALVILTCWLPTLWSDGLVAFWQSFVWLVFGLLHLIPQLPDYWRAKYELEAYIITMYFEYMITGNIPNSTIEWLVELFTNMSYYKMVVSKEKMKRKLFKIRTKIYMSDHPVKDDPLILLYYRVKARTCKKCGPDCFECECK